MVWLQYSPVTVDAVFLLSPSVLFLPDFSLLFTLCFWLSSNLSHLRLHSIFRLLVHLNPHHPLILGLLLIMNFSPYLPRPCSTMSLMHLISHNSAGPGLGGCDKASQADCSAQITLLSLFHSSSDCLRMLRLVPWILQLCTR